MDTLTYAGPAVRKLARELGIDLADVTGTGDGGRVQTEDVYRHVQHAMSRKTAVVAPTLSRVEEADITDLEPLRQHLSAASGTDITVLTCVIKAVSAVRQHDSSFNFPVTIETPDGLRVPVPGHTPNLGLAHIARNLAASATALPNDQRPSAILSVGIATKKAVWNGEEFTPRLVLPLTLSCDPSVANGAHATRLLADVAGVLADFRQTLL